MRHIAAADGKIKVHIFEETDDATLSDYQVKLSELEREAAVQQLVVQARCTAEATAREAAAAAADPSRCQAAPREALPLPN